MTNVPAAKTTPDKRPVFKLTLRPLPGCDGERAVKALLKAALRRHRLQCVSVELLQEAARVFRPSHDADPQKVPGVITMDTSEFSKQRYMKAARLDKSVIATVAGFEVHEMRDGAQKPVLVFENGQPAFVLNQDALYALQDTLGFESEHWIGARVELSPATFKTQGGEIKPMITLKVVEKPGSTGEAAEAAGAPRTKQVKPQRDDLDEPIPY